MSTVFTDECGRASSPNKTSEVLVTPCTKMQQAGSKLSPKIPLRAYHDILRNGGVGERLKPAVLKSDR